MTDNEARLVREVIRGLENYRKPPATPFDVKPSLARLQGMLEGMLIVHDTVKQEAQDR